MKLANTTCLTIAFALTTGLVLAGEVAVKFTKAPTAKKAGGKVSIEFAMDKKTDVEVSVLDAKGKVVRHLAAGVLGGKTPPPSPLKAGLSQSLEWDGKDDYGEAAKGTPFNVRVRAGMSAKLERIVGGDPYAFYSKEMGQGDHAAWRITGLEAKSDGSVYVMGNANNYGPPAIRRYDAEGNYLRTVYPPPAGKPVAGMKGWGVNIRADGTYAPQYNDLSSPALSKTIICGTRGRIANLIPSPGKDQLLIEYGFKLMKVNTDGTIPPSPILGGLLVNEPSIAGVKRKLTGQMQVCPSPDGKHLYIGGIFAGALGPRRRRVGAEKTGPWRDGQIFKVDVATRKASVFFALDESKVITSLKARGSSPIADARYGNYAALQGVAVDAQGRVFVCDRQNKRIVILDAAGKIIREIPVAYPDAVAVAPKSKALYVTTRLGHFHKKGKLTLLKFADWSRDTAPVATVPLCDVHHFSQPTHLAAAEAGKGTFVWVAYSALPVRVFRDKGAALELVKDFYRDASQRALDLQHFVVDQKTEGIYIADGFNNCFRITDWKDPKFVRAMTGARTKLRALSMAIDSRNRYLYCHQDRRPVTRFKLDGEFLTPAPLGGGNAFTPKISNDWRIGLGMGDRGIAVAPDGSLVTLNALGTGADYSGYLRFYRADPAKAPWEGLLFKSFGVKVRAAGARFDPRGNLYVGKYDGKPKDPPRGFEKDRNFMGSTGRIYKFAATGSLKSGKLFPKDPGAPTKVYDVHYGVIGPSFSRTPRFGVDGWGRIYYPTSLLPQVSVIDNEGNPILNFGTYGNRDSMGGLKGNKVPTKGIPMAWPNSVDVTDDYIYVSDIVNIRMLRITKKFEVEARSKIQSR